MLIGKPCHASAARRAVYEAYLYQIRLVNILESYRFLPHRGGKSIQPDGSSVVKFYYRFEHPPVGIVKPQLIYFEHAQCRIRDITRYLAVTLDLRIVAHTLEQAVNWDWFSALIKNAKRPIKVLNLFAYTGGATVAAAAAGASVCHVDAAKNMVAQAKENAALSGLENAPIRYIVDDCKKFVEREIRRGNRYDAVIMDPPSYGRGPSGEIWKLEDNIAELIRLAADVLSDKPLFFLVNSYTTGLSPSAMGYMLGLEMKKRFGGRVEADEIGIPVLQTGEALPCGSSARWTAE